MPLVMSAPRYVFASLAREKIYLYFFFDHVRACSQVSLDLSFEDETVGMTTEESYCIHL